MQHGFNFSKLFFLSTLVFTYSMRVIISFFNNRDLTLGARCTPNQIVSDVTLSISCDQGKITKGLKDTGVTDDWQGVGHPLAS